MKNRKRKGERGQYGIEFQLRITFPTFSFSLILLSRPPPFQTSSGEKETTAKKGGQIYEFAVDRHDLSACQKNGGKKREKAAEKGGGKSGALREGRVFICGDFSPFFVVICERGTCALARMMVMFRGGSDVCVCSV